MKAAFKQKQPHLKLENRRRRMNMIPGAETELLMSRVNWSDNAKTYYLGSDDKKWVWTKPSERTPRLTFTGCSQVWRRKLWWCEAACQIFWVHNEWSLERWVCSWALRPLYPLRLLYQPLQIQKFGMQSSALPWILAGVIIERFMTWGWYSVKKKSCSIVAPQSAIVDWLWIDCMLFFLTSQWLPNDYQMTTNSHLVVNW